MDYETLHSIAYLEMVILGKSKYFVTKGAHFTADSYLYHP